MTQPVAHGYADWNRVSAISNVIYLNSGAVNVGTLQTFGPFFVADQAAIGLLLQADVNNWQFRVNFYDSLAQTILLARYEFSVVGGGNSFQQSVAGLGPWMTITANPFVAASTCTVMAWGVAAPASALSFDNVNSLISTTANAIAIGATEDQFANKVWPGNAFLCFQMLAGTATLEVRSTDYTGTSFTIWRRFLTAAQPVGEMICLTGGTPMVRIVNTSGAATSYNLYLTGQLHIARS